MYQEFFSLKEQPFSISPDPDFLFLSDRHREALAHLKYGLRGNGGFVLLTGEVGTGKTTVCRALLRDLSVDTDVAFILNPAQTEVELLATICDQLEIAYEVERASLKILFDAISGWMINNLQRGRNAIVLIDEAQHLSFSVLEQLRLLTNIETNNKKPLQVILIGQTELQQKLKENKLRQLAQRITARYHLLPINQQETEYYIQHRLNVAGAMYPIFESYLLKYIFQYSRGIPRLINLICDRSMLCAYSQNSLKVTPEMIDLAVKEIDLSLEEEATNRSFKYIWRLLLLISLIGITVWQVPNVLRYLSAPDVVVNVPKKVIPPVPLEPPRLPIINELDSSPESDERQKIGNYVELEEENLTWFDNYPELDLRKGEFAHALQTLYAVWGYSVTLRNSTCQNGETVSLQCFSDNTSLATLKQTNYPAVIKLVNDQDFIYAVLYKIDKGYQVLVGTQKIDVSEAWLKEYWNGGLTLLWRAPFDMSEPLKLDQEGTKVAWLNDQLNTLYHLPDIKKDIFDWQLKEQVVRFQSENNLTADGIVGKRTLISLLQQVEPSTPSL